MGKSATAKTSRMSHCSQTTSELVQETKKFKGKRQISYEMLKPDKWQLDYEDFEFLSEEEKLEESYEELNRTY